MLNLNGHLAINAKCFETKIVLKTKLTSVLFLNDAIVVKNGYTIYSCARL